MLILVISDTHGRITNAVNIIEKLKPDYILHLGDVVRDVEDLEAIFPSKDIIAVSGNNDFWASAKYSATERLLDLDGKKIFMCHGHTYGVKRDNARVIHKARTLGADIALYGHTHSAYNENHNGLHVINPGSYGTYAVIEIDKSGNTNCEIRKAD